MTDELLKSVDICNILDACFRNGVTRLTFGGLNVSFVTLPKMEHESVSAETIAEEVLGNTIQAQQQAENLSHEEQGILLREDQIAELLISDPAKAEEMMMYGELEPEGEDDGV